MRYVVYVLYSIVGWLSTLVAIVLSPLLAAYSVVAGVSVLPGWLQLLSTPDDDLDGEQHQNHQPPASGIRLWWQRTCWICRNPALGVHAEVIGIPVEGSSTTIDFESGDSSTTSYRRRATIARGGREYFESVAHFPLARGRYWGWWLGWKTGASPIPYHVWKMQVFLFRRP